jgi:hypothetical protein
MKAMKRYHAVRERMNGDLQRQMAAPRCRQWALGLLLGVCLLTTLTATVGAAAAGTTYYLAPGGGDSAGDTLIVKDGTYTNALSNPPSGTASAYTIVRAENDGNAIIKGGGISIGSPSTSQSYIQVEGFKLVNSEVYITNSHHIKLLRTGLKNPAPTDARYDAGIGIECGSHHVLLEDVWVIGSFRYGISVFESYNNILRRVVVRWDINTGQEPKAGINFYGAGSGTGCHSNSTIEAAHDNLCQNCVALDFNSGSEGGINMPHGSYNNKVYGGIFVNIPSNAIAGHEQSPGGGDDVVNSATVNTDGFTLRDGDSSKTDLYDHITAVQTQYPVAYWSIYGTRPRVVIQNSLFYGNTNGPNVGDVLTNNLNATSKPQYLLRSPDGSHGATIEKRYGVDGTLWGETGYDQLTATSLWPWPNEQRIHDAAAESDSPAYSNTPARGFAVPGMTLSRYIWEYLGTQCPMNMCSSSAASPPSPPMNLRAR